jgi:hypothetical protein
VEWQKEATGGHEALAFEGPAGAVTDASTRKYSRPNTKFSPDDPEPADCFFAFMPLDFIDKVATWTKAALESKESTKQRYKGMTSRIDRHTIMGVFVVWQLVGLLKLPEGDMYFRLGLQASSSFVRRASFIFS